MKSLRDTRVKGVGGMRRLGATVLGIAGFLFGAASCNQLGGIHEGVPRGADPVVPCSAVEDCAKVEAPECRVPVACDRGLCRYGDALEGTPAKTQAPGDCTEVVCDGAGRTKLSPRETDVPDDGDVCTLDTCAGTTPVHSMQTELPCYTGPGGTKGKGICVEGTQHCDAQGNAIGGCEGQVLPAAETCISPLDEDCDGKANEQGQGCECVPGAFMPCYTGPGGTHGVGVCHSGMQSCNGDGLTYGPCVGEQKPEAETCDAGKADDDCDGEVNEEGADCTCGDGYLSTGEECEDGGTSDGDPCSPTCKEQKVLQVSIGLSHTCALLNDGNVKCWGQNDYGQLGLSDTSYRGDGPNEMGDNLLAIDLGTSKTASAVVTGHHHTCALLNDGSVKCWGFNAWGQLGLGDTSNRGDGPNEMGNNLPAVNLGTGKTASAIVAGTHHTCAFLNDGTVKCWGYNDSGSLGLGDTNRRGDGPNEMGDNLPAVNLGTGTMASVIVAGHVHTCALLNDGSVKCWGEYNYGNLGLDDTISRGDEPNEMGDNLPAVNVGAGKTASAVVTGHHHTCALLNDGSVKCWGWNSNGQLGLGDTIDRGDGPNDMGDNLPAVNLGTGKTASAVSAGGGHTCSLLNNGSVKCWGQNSSGQLGLGDTSARGDQPNEMGDNLPTVKLFSAFW